MVLRSSRGKKRIKNGPKLDKNFTKPVTWSFSDTFWTYFCWILLRNNTSFHLRLIKLICDHFDEFYKQKTDQKRAEKSSKTVKNHPKLVISSHMLVTIWPHMAYLTMFLSHTTYTSHILPHMGSNGCQIAVNREFLGENLPCSRLQKIIMRPFFDVEPCPIHQNDHIVHSYNLYNSYLQKSKNFSIKITNKFRNQPQN